MPGRCVAILLILFVLLSVQGKAAALEKGSQGAFATLVPSATLVEPEDGVRPLVRLLDRAQRSIFVEAYILSDRSILHALERAAAQGVLVDVLLERHPFGLGTFPEHVARELRAADVAVRWSSSRFVYTHAKFMVFDDSTSVISTANFSRSGFKTNREVLVVDRSRQDVHDLSNIFRADWDRVPATFRSPDLIVSPVDARRDLQRFITAAHHTIDLYAEEMQDTGMERVLSERRHAGVRVRVLLPPSALHGSASPNARLRRLLTIRSLGSPYVHAKVIVVDDTYAFVGSENLSSTSLDRNREVGVFLRGRAVSRLARVFARDWGKT